MRASGATGAGNTPTCSTMPRNPNSATASSILTQDDNYDYDGDDGHDDGESTTTTTTATTITTGNNDSDENDDDTPDGDVQGDRPAAAARQRPASSWDGTLAGAEAGLGLTAAERADIRRSRSRCRDPPPPGITAVTERAEGEHGRAG